VDQAKPSDRIETVEQPYVRLGVAHRQNSFDTIRMIAAFCVFYGHQLTLSGYTEPVSFAGRIALSSLGLYVFFALSGYLVYQSLARDSTLVRYAQARVLRIYPAYIVNILFVAALGCVFTSLPLGEYLTAPGTLRYVFINLPIVATPTQFSLPGVFEEARWQTVNGSIWTVKYEILCYVLLFILYRVIKKDFLRYALVVFAILLIANHVYHISNFALPAPEQFFAEYTYFNVSRFFMTFFFGSLLAAWEPISSRALFWLLAALALVVGFFPDPEVVKVGTILLLTVLVVTIGKTRLLFSTWYRRLGDLSYGFFLYAYPIQNAIWTYYSQGRGFYTVALVTGLTIFACALLSWHLVEKPMLALKRPPARLAAAPKLADSQLA
jgi:peptidoglycan/LPS O-acetylase OafA/YrhL